MIYDQQYHECRFKNCMCLWFKWNSWCFIRMDFRSCGLVLWLCTSFLSLSSEKMDGKALDLKYIQDGFRNHPMIGEVYEILYSTA